MWNRGVFGSVFPLSFISRASWKYGQSTTGGGSSELVVVYSFVRGGSFDSRAHLPKQQQSYLVAHQFFPDVNRSETNVAFGTARPKFNHSVHTPRINSASLMRSLHKATGIVEVWTPSKDDPTASGTNQSLVGIGKLALAPLAMAYNSYHLP